MGRKLIQRLGSDSLYPCVLGHEFPARGWEWRAVPPFLLRAGKLRDWTRKPRILYILLSWGVKKHVQLLICIYLAVLCDMLRALLSSIVNSILLHNALFHAQPDKVWVESWSTRYLPLRFARIHTPDPPRRGIIPNLFTPNLILPRHFPPPNSL